MRNGHSHFAWMAGTTALAGILVMGVSGELSARRQQQGSSPMKTGGIQTATQYPGFYCNLKAFTPEEREHHKMMGQELAMARSETRELADGYAFRLDGERVSLADLADWVADERKCCPFFDFEIVQEREGGALWLKLRGNDGVKLFIRSEFRIAPMQGAQSAARPLNKISMSEALDEWVAKTEQLLVPAAEAMPEEKYSFAPTNGQFAGVRTFAEQVKHLAAANYQLGALALGERPPHDEHGETAPGGVNTKAEIMEYLKGSFAYLHKVADSIDEKNAAEQVELSGGKRKSTRVGLLIDALAHSRNHYGQMVEYLRMNGIVPPASR